MQSASKDGRQHLKMRENTFKDGGAPTQTVGGWVRGGCGRSGGDVGRAGWAGVCGFFLKNKTQDRPASYHIPSQGHQS